jgi:ribosomal protein S18 acetylase RimI-like enzyme
VGNTANDLELRPARESDYQAIVDMCKGSVAEVYGPIMGYEAVQPWAEGDATDKHIRRMLPNSFVALSRDKLLGVMILEDDLVDLLWVASGQRSRGVGAALLNLAEETLKRQGYPLMRLECFELNTRALSFYIRRGWQKTNRYLDEQSGIYKVLMIKEPPNLK